MEEQGLLHLFLALWLFMLVAVVEVIIHQELLELVELEAGLLAFITQLLMMAL
jgi:hypothetical protein